MKALITKGCVTDHGGIVQESDNTYLINGIPVHLEGMKHFCPKCQIMVSTQSSSKGFLMSSNRTIIMAGDKATCGATYLPNQSLVVRDAGVGSSTHSSSVLSNFLNTSSPQVFDEQVAAEFSFAEGMPYLIETTEGKIYQGTIGSDGRLPRIETEGHASYKLYLGEEALTKRGGNAS
ncbi:PAAR domain-containing protein [Acinetobacter vivianii]|uniref:PAAR domain-containing protein n=1 Tax=Acinetobacter vivianii TaxID=1776742 RepID=UPI002DBC535A|nr:PAAR domain-containing protein [Acinetobacter vivianii]